MHNTFSKQQQTFPSQSTFATTEYYSFCDHKCIIVVFIGDIESYANLIHLVLDIFPQECDTPVIWFASMWSLIPFHWPSFPHLLHTAPLPLESLHCVTVLRLYWCDSGLLYYNVMMIIILSSYNHTCMKKWISWELPSNAHLCRGAPPPWPWSAD